MDLVERAAARAEDVRFMLRSRTRRAHEELDSHPAFAAMTDGTLTFDRYRQVMRALHGVYMLLDPMIETDCARFDMGRLGFAYAPRAPLLADDLAALDSRLPLVDDRRDEPPLHASYAGVLTGAPGLAGVLYVVEGSVLGGAMLFRATRGILGRTAMSGNSYWSWCAEEGGGRWAATCRLLAHLDTSETARGEMAAAAHATFAMIARALRPLRREMEASAC